MLTWNVCRFGSTAKIDSTQRSVYLSIYGIYIAPLQGTCNYSEALPTLARAKKVLRRL